MKLRSLAWPLVGSVLMLGFGALLLTGCRPDPVDWNVEILAETDKSVRLDVIGINLIQKTDFWDRLNVDTYWGSESSLRENATRLTFDIVDGKISIIDSRGVPIEGITGSGSKLVTIPRTHPIWKKWKANNSVALVAIGRYPGGSTNPAGAQDPRKRLIPLFKQCWETKDRTLRLTIQDDGPKIATPPSRKAPAECFGSTGKPLGEEIAVAHLDQGLRRPLDSPST